MDYDSIQREIRIDASPEVVFAVISDPVHVRHWWPDEATYEPVSGGAGEIVFGKDGERYEVGFEVVDAVPLRLFSFRWTHPRGTAPQPDNSLLVRFELEPDGEGTLLRMTETGFREQAWTAAELEETYLDHSRGWDYHLARLAPYVSAHLAATR